jgi:hypothetical protein
MSKILPWTAIGVLVLGACGDDDACDPVAQTGCDDGQVCEAVQGADQPACFSPLRVRGQVFDLVNESAIADARVVALDINAAPASAVALTDIEGDYELTIPSTRLEDGTPVGQEITLRADARGYQTFPAGIRLALPIDTSSAVAEDGGYVVESSLTSIGLVPLPAASGTGSIYGTVELPADGGGVLVVAAATAGYSAIADRDGSYAILNLPAGSYQVEGYARGVNYAPASAEVVEGGDEEVDLALADAPTSTLNGKIEVVNPEGGSVTSVVLIVESTFDEELGRGAMAPGLRAPEPGIAPDVANTFTIEGIPAGRYVILAGFENDLLVRDPDHCISGTDIVHQEIVSGQDVTLDESFKLTGALAVFGPGADGVEVVGATPTFSWDDDSGEERYDLVVLDSLGNVVWEHQEDGYSGSNPEVVYAGPALDAGSYYQFRVTSLREVGGDWCEMATTEDLRGVFLVE